MKISHIYCHVELSQYCHKNTVEKIEKLIKWDLHEAQQWLPIVKCIERYEKPLTKMEAKILEKLTKFSGFARETCGAGVWYLIG